MKLEKNLILLLNSDTHHPYGFSPECILGDTSNESFYEAYKCSGTIIKKFFDDLDNLGILENTVVVVMGDHLAFRDLFGSLNKREKEIFIEKLIQIKKFKDQK